MLFITVIQYIPYNDYKYDIQYVITIELKIIIKIYSKIIQIKI